ncbi:MAG: hypothetical protein M5R41_00445 [Bacteroidia bacterium]|nr:hypothetical protein [Bacteroidia bacterium]
MTCREFTGIAMLCMMFLGATMNAQNNNQRDAHSARCTITSTDGLTIEGQESGWSADTLILTTRDGVEVRIPSSSILALTRILTPDQEQSASHSAVSGVSVLNPQIPRSRRGSPNLYLIPTAYPESAGDLRLGLQEVFFPTIAYGIAGYVTIQGGTSVFPDADGQLLHTTLKVTPFTTTFGAISAGFTYFTADEYSTTAPFLVGTVNLGGPRGNYLTCGMGYQSDEEDYFMVAGIDLPVSDHVRLMTELFLIRDQRQISYCTPGVRLQAGAFDIDLGVILPLQMEPLEFLPWIGASIVL